MNEKRQALIVTALGGFVRSFLLSDVEILQQLGFEVHCAANLKHPGNLGLEDFFKEHGIVFHQIDFSSNSPFSRSTLNARHQLKQLDKNFKFELVHAHTPIAGALCRSVFKKERKKGTKILYTTHGFPFHKKSSFKSWALFYSIEKHYSKYTDVLITINKEDYSAAKKMHCEKVRYIPGVGVDIEKFTECPTPRECVRNNLGIDENEFFILSIGELSNRKNHQVVIKAISRLSGFKCVYAICGNEMNKKSTKKQLLKLATENGVRLLLLGLRKDVNDIIHSADIGILPSVREGLGLSGIEMIAGNLPLIASNVQGIVDYVKEDVNGKLFDPFDDIYLSKLIEYMHDEINRKKIRNSSIGSVDAFDKKFSHEAMLTIYKEILK